ncbi:MAG: ABC transporter substrate-binding protein [Deltaproteobacteria bacterium]|nr:ABC transporter substrate-binding protein [Deltaproteobacteria bacterium]
MKKRMVLFVAVVTSLILSAGSLIAYPKDEVRVALAYEPATVNIMEMKGGIDIPVVVVMHESILATDPITGDRVLKNSLSESMIVLPDNKSIQVRMRKNARFHTGDPVTAYDVQFTYEQITNPKNANMMAPVMDEIEEIEVIDDYNLIFHLYEPYAPWKELFWIGIVSKKYYEKVGREKFRKHPVGSGPFKFVERKSGEYVLFEAWRERPTWKLDYKTLRFMTIPDDVTRLAMLETGEVDIVSNILPHNLKRLKRNKHVVIKRESRVPSLFGLSVKPDNFPIFKDSTLTDALSYAINRQEIVDRVFLGEGYPMWIYASKSELGYDPKFSDEFNPEKARQLIKKSKYKPGDPMILSYSSSVPNSSMIAAMVQRYLSKVGLTIKLQQLEAGIAATYNRNRDPREGHMTLYAWGGGRDPSIRLQMSIVSDSPYSSWATRPRVKELDALVAEQAKEMDEAKRLKLLNKIHAILDESSGGPVLLGANMIYAHSDRIDYNWQAHGEYVYNLHRIKMVKK